MINRYFSLKKLKEVQDKILAKDDNLKHAIVNLQTSHITLNVLRLPDDTAIETAKGIVESSSELLNQITTEPFNINIVNLNNFNKRVIFADVTKNDQFETLKKIKDSFSQSLNEFITDKREYNPHVTLFKITQKTTKKTKMKKFDVDYEDLMDIDFGEQEVNSIQLLSMTHPKEVDGYYKSFAQVEITSPHI